jgi:hypothetical protein
VITLAGRIGLRNVIAFVRKRVGQKSYGARAAKHRRSSTKAARRVTPGDVIALFVYNDNA